MRAYHGADGVYINICGAEPLANLLRHIFHVVLAVAVADEHRLMGVVDARFSHVLHQGIQTLAAAAHLSMG